MAAVLYWSMRTETKLALPREEMIAQVIRCEKRTFPRREAFDFGTELKKRNLALLIAVDDDSMTATTRMAAYMVLSFVKPGNTATLHKICVEPHYRGQGIATKALKAHAERLKSRGCSKLQLWVDENNALARKLYTSIGFEEMSSVPNYYAIGRTGVHMVLRLAS